MKKLTRKQTSAIAWQGGLAEMMIIIALEILIAV